MLWSVKSNALTEIERVGDDTCDGVCVVCGDGVLLLVGDDLGVDALAATA